LRIQSGVFVSTMVFWSPNIMIMYFTASPSGVRTHP
jgi:hypothetical protein